jgi:hypothetical protein
MAFLKNLLLLTTMVLSVAAMEQDEWQIRRADVFSQGAHDTCKV